MTSEIQASVGRDGVNRPDDVRAVQHLLNRVGPDNGGPDEPLAADGLVGTQTIAAIEQFQRQALGFQWPDGRVDVGGVTWGRLIEVAGSLLGAAVAAATAPAAPSTPPAATPDLQREAIALLAAAEQQVYGATVHARQPGGTDPINGRTFRQGHERLHEYFRTAAPAAGDPSSTYFGDDGVHYLQAPGKLTPIPHWCGLFALWAIRTSLGPLGVDAGTWKMGSGVDRAFFTTTTAPQKGDIAYRDQPFQHHAIVIDVHPGDDGHAVVETIDGNSGATSTITRTTAPIDSWDLFLTLRSLSP